MPKRDEQERRTALELQDILDDLMSGYEFWKSAKCASGEISTLDEMLIRWVEHV